MPRNAIGGPRFADRLSLSAVNVGKTLTPSYDFEGLAGRRARAKGVALERPAEAREHCGMAETGGAGRRSHQPVVTFVKSSRYGGILT